MKYYYLGLAANYDRKRLWRHIFAIGRRHDETALQRYLTQKYNGETILTKNGRSALTLALKAYIKPGDGVIVNGFTCYAVCEAIKAAKLVPIWADIDKDGLNFNVSTLDAAMQKHTNTDQTLSANPNAKISGVIIQNSLGNPIDIAAIEKYAKQHGLVVVEDLAHCAGMRYSDGREAGTVGTAAVLSFGKDKSIDTISGGAVVLRSALKNEVKAPDKTPRLSDTLRARFYPLFGVIARGLTHVHLGGIWMRMLVKIHWVEKSADNKLDTTRRIAKFEAKMALRQLKALKNAKWPLRQYCLVDNRDEALKELRKNGYYFDGLWYEKPVSPKRYYKKVRFPEEECPTATEVAKKIINLPMYYDKQSLVAAEKIIDKYREE